MPDETVGWGLLGPHKSAEELRREREQNLAAAEKIRQDIEFRRSLMMLGPGALGFGQNWIEQENLRREARLLDFALKRNLSLTENWKEAAIYLAAMEHDEIKADPKRRGPRPKYKYSSGPLGRALRRGLLDIGPDDEEALVSQIDGILREFEKAGRAPVQREAIEEYMRRCDPVSPVASNYAPTVDKYEKRLGRIRKSMGKSLKPGPKSKPITDANSG